MPVRHMVLFVWNNDVRDDHVERVGAALAELPAAIPAIREYRYGPDLGLNQANATYAVTALFDDDAGYLEYRDHPVHQAFITDHIAGNVASRSAIQIRVD